MLKSATVAHIVKEKGRERKKVRKREREREMLRREHLRTNAN